MRVRLVPFANISERLYRVARQTAKELDLKASLDIRGGQVEIDRSVDVTNVPIADLDVVTGERVQVVNG
jgi:hypothetical protein